MTDLSLDTAWERIPLSDLAKKSLWKLESERYAMITPGLREYNQAFLEKDGTGARKRVPYSRVRELRNEAWSLFSSLDMFFVKVCKY